MTTDGHGGGTRPIAHPGIDIEAPYGTEVLAVADGTVNDIDLNKNAGMNLWIAFSSEDTGLKKRVVAQYAHLKVHDPINAGTEVKRGQSLGRLVPYPGHSIHHLHIEFRAKGKIIDPMRVFMGDLTTPVASLPSKAVKIPYLTDKGTLHPPKTKLIWPLMCKS